MTQLEENALRRRIQNNGSALGSLANGHGAKADLQERLEEVEKDKRELGEYFVDLIYGGWDEGLGFFCFFFEGAGPNGSLANGHGAKADLQERLEEVEK